MGLLAGNDVAHPTNSAWRRVRARLYGPRLHREVLGLSEGVLIRIQHVVPSDDLVDVTIAVWEPRYRREIISP